MPDQRGTFYQYEAAFVERLAKAVEAAHSVSDLTLDGSDPAVLLDAILADHAARRVEIVFDDFRIDPHEAPRIAGQPLPSGPPSLTLDFIVPCKGAAGVLRGAAPQGRGYGDQYELVMPMIVPETMPVDGATLETDIRATRDQWFEKLTVAANNANTVIDVKRREMSEAIDGIIRGRWSRRRALSTAANALNIPLVAAIPYAVGVPLIPATLNLEAVDAAARAGGSETGLATSIADALISQISAFSNALERMPVTANKLAGQDEESIRDVLLFILNANWKGSVTGETFLGSGKTDILLRWHDRDAFIGECKIWKGEVHFAAGLNQLLDRYTVWRATRVALILFIRDVRDVRDVSAIVEKAKSSIIGHDRFIGPARLDQPEPSYSMRAQHDQAQVVTLTLIPVVMPDPQAARHD